MLAGGHADEVGDERRLAVGHYGIVLDVCLSRVLCDGLGRLALVEHQIVERGYGAFVLLQLRAAAHTITSAACVHYKLSHNGGSGMPCFENFILGGTENGEGRRLDRKIG